MTKEDKKRRKEWIPNQVGDDIECAFGDDIGVVFGDDSGDVIPATSMSFPRKRESRKSFFSNRKEKRIGSCFDRKKQKKK